MEWGLRFYILFKEQLLSISLIKDLEAENVFVVITHRRCLTSLQKKYLPKNYFSGRIYQTKWLGPISSIQDPIFDQEITMRKFESLSL